MARTAHEIYQEALELNEAERAHLADLLEASMDKPSIEQAWLDEANRRIADIDAGRTEMIASDQVFARLRSRLKRA